MSDDLVWTCENCAGEIDPNDLDIVEEEGWYFCNSECRDAYYDVEPRDADTT